jgi:hypothetical protein
MTTVKQWTENLLEHVLFFVFLVLLKRSWAQSDISPGFVCPIQCMCFLLKIHQIWHDYYYEYSLLFRIDFIIAKGHMYTLHTQITNTWGCNLIPEEVWPAKTVPWNPWSAFLSHDRFHYFCKRLKYWQILQKIWSKCRIWIGQTE